MKDVILVIAAHPDDEVLGCGGTIAQLANDGHDVYSLILGEGITSRSNKESPKKQKIKLERLKKQAIMAGKILGVKKTFFAEFPDNCFDEASLLAVVKKVEEIRNQVLPTVIYTHSNSDLNIDHKITYEAVITAFRPLPGEIIKQIYSFEILSSTEWNYPAAFVPNVYVDVTNTVELKKKAMRKYLGELKLWPHPRSLKGIDVLSQKRGMETGLRYAEAFQLVRDIRKN